MDLLKAFRDYVTRMVTDVPGPKVLLLDKETVTMVSLVYTQSEILQKEVLLVEKLDKAGRTKMKHLNALVFVRPTLDSVHHLKDELREPKYKNYYIYFSNIVQVAHIEQLAEADAQAAVVEMQEMFGDYYVVNRDSFQLNIPHAIVDAKQSLDAAKSDRCTEGLISVLLALKKRPVIRYEANSDLARKLARNVHYVMQQESSLFDFRAQDSPPLLLLLDRRNDPVTPLLNQWTYQAMIHELLGIENNVVDSGNFETKAREAKGDSAAQTAESNNIVLSAYQDAFYQKNMFLNFGDLGSNIKEYVEEYKVKTKTTANIETLDDIKRFVQDYPQFRQLAGNVTKHVSLVSELSQRVDRDLLLEVSELEQEMACTEDHNEQIRRVYMILSNPKINNQNKLRVAILYALRYERFPQNDIRGVIDKLQQMGMPGDSVTMVEGMLRYAGADQRLVDLFGNQNMLARGMSQIKKGLKGVENIYTQHQPLLARTLDMILKSKTKERDMLYPYVEATTRDRPQDVIIFVIGGFTYEESRYISQLNFSTPGMRFAIGGTSVLNSKSFLGDTQEALKRLR